MKTLIQAAVATLIASSVELSPRRLCRSAPFGLACIALAGFLPAASSCLAADRFVPAQYPTIQAAVAACQSGDRVLVAPGTYAGPVQLGGGGVQLVSEQGPELTVITGRPLPSPGPAIFISSGLVEGFRLTGGTTSIVPGSSCGSTFGFRSGGGVFATGGTIRNCHVIGNNGDGNPSNDAVGHGMTIVGNVAVQDCIIEQNGGSGCCPSAFGRAVASGVFVHGIATLERCLIRGNFGTRAAGIKVGHCDLTGGTAVLRDCVVYGNSAESCAQAENYFGALVLENSHVYGQVCGAVALVGNGAVMATMQDCNSNSLPDAWECISGMQADLNDNQVPDSCECIGDLFPNGTINGADLGILLSEWGPALPTTVSDLNRDGAVDGSDLGYLLSQWGPCTN